MDMFADTPSFDIFSTKRPYEICDVPVDLPPRPESPKKKRRVNLNVPGEHREAVIARLREKIESRKRK